ATPSQTTAHKLDNVRAASYQRYQRQKLADRLNAFTYWILTKVVDSHHVGRGRGSIEDALSQITARALVIDIQSDLLFPLSEQRYLARHILQAAVQVINSSYGHDGFLVEFDQLNTILKHFYREKISVLS